MKKKILVFVLLVALLVNALPAHAAPAPTLRVETVTAEPGETVEVTIWLENNPGIGSIALDVEFDPALTLENVEFNDSLKGSKDANTDETSAYLLWMWNDFNKKNQVFNLYGDLAFATLTFVVSEDATAGTYPVTISYEQEDVYANVFYEDSETFDFADVVFDVVNGGVQIEGQAVAVTGVSLDKETLSLTEGESAQLTATVAPAEADNKAVTFTSSDAAVVSVDANGKVTAVKAGSAVITVTTADGGFTATCAVTVNCGHTNKTETAATESTCATQGWDAYESCDDCGQLFDESHNEIDEIPFRPLSGTHTGGSATCTELAVCTACGTAYGAYGEHNYTAQEKSEDTMTKVGTCANEAVYFYSCSVCGKVEGNPDHTFKGEKNPDNHTGGTALDGQCEADHANQIDGNTGTEICLGCEKVLVPGTVIPAGDHVAGDVWSKDETGHWKVCSIEGCDAKMEVTAHTPDHTGGATEQYAVKCTECGYVIEEQLDHVHDFQEIVDDAFLASAADCENAAKYYVSCACGETGETTFEHGVALGHKWQDATCEHPQICSRCLETRGEPDGHNWEEATCLRPKTCSRCLKTEGEALGHKWQDATCTAPKTCEVCKRTEGEALGHKPDREETTEENAVKCSVCGEILIPALDHTHKIEHVAESCYNEEYWVCELCETYWADEELIVITNSKNVIKAVATHDLVHVAESCYNTEHWFCEACEIYWSDEALTQITNSKNVIKAVPSHKVEHVAESCYNEEYWFCEVCQTYWADEALTQITNSKNVIKAVPSHELEHVAESCYNEEYWTCAICQTYWSDEALTQITNSKNVIKAVPSHELKHVEAVEATCWVDGNSEHWYCEICNTVWADEALTQITNHKNVIVPGGHKAEHVAESCYNVEYWVCYECETYWADEALTQITNSKNVIKAVPSHELEHYEAVAPTCHDRGNVEYWHCVKCDGYFMDEACTQLTNAMSIWLGENGSENLQHVERVEPTAETEGNVEYWYCPDCGRYFLDEACTQLTNAKNVIIPKVSTPVTGDTTNLIVLVTLMAISAMGAAVIFTKKRRAA